MSTLDARKSRREKMKKKETFLVTQIGNYDMTPLSVFNITTTGNNIFILTRDSQCAKIKFYDNVLYISILKRCSYRGTITLKRIIAFADRNGLTIELEDESMLDDYDIELSLLKILQTGNTWYAKYGFKNGLENYQDVIQEFIKTPYKDTTYQARAIELAERLKHGDESVVEELNDLCKIMESFLTTLPYTSSHRRGGTRKIRCKKN